MREDRLVVQLALIVILLTRIVCAGDSIPGCLGKNVSQGFDAKFYSYPLESNQGFDPGYFYSGYRKMSTQVGFVRGVTNIKFGGKLPPELHPKVHQGNIYGQSISVSNFSLELTGWFLPPLTGQYTFYVRYPDDAMSLQVGKNGSCCGDFDQDIISSEVRIAGSKFVEQALFKIVILEKDTYYPIRLFYINSAGDYSLNFKVLRPDWKTQDVFDNVYQIKVPHCRVVTTASVTRASQRPSEHVPTRQSESESSIPASKPTSLRESSHAADITSFASANMPASGQMSKPETFRSSDVSISWLRSSKNPTISSFFSSSVVSDTMSNITLSSASSVSSILSTRFVSQSASTAYQGSCLSAKTAKSASSFRSSSWTESSVISQRRSRNAASWSATSLTPVPSVSITKWEPSARSFSLSRGDRSSKTLRSVIDLKSFTQSCSRYFSCSTISSPEFTLSVTTSAASDCASSRMAAMPTSVFKTTGDSTCTRSFHHSELSSLKRSASHHASSSAGKNARSRFQSNLESTGSSTARISLPSSFRSHLSTNGTLYSVTKSSKKDLSTNTDKPATRSSGPWPNRFSKTSLDPMITISTSICESSTFNASTNISSFTSSGYMPVPSATGDYGEQVGHSRFRISSPTSSHLLVSFPGLNFTNVENTDTDGNSATYNGHSSADSSKASSRRGNECEMCHTMNRSSTKPTSAVSTRVYAGSVDTEAEGSAGDVRSTKNALTSDLSSLPTSVTDFQTTKKLPHASQSMCSLPSFQYTPSSAPGSAVQYSNLTNEGWNVPISLATLAIAFLLAL